MAKSTAKMKLAMAIEAVDEASKPLQKIARASLRLVDPAEKAERAVSKVGRRRNFRPLLRSVRRLGRALSKVATKIRALARRSALWIGAGFAAAGALVYKVAAAGDKIAKTADKLGLGIEPLQELRYAAERSGLSVEQFDKSMEYLVRTAGEAAAGVGAAKDVYKALGIDVKDANGNLKGGETLLTEVADALAKVENPTARATLAYKLFGRSGMAMVNMLRDGSKGLSQLRQEARDTGSVMSEQTARHSETFQDRLLDLKRIVVGLAQTLVGRFLPAINNIMTGLRDWYQANRELVTAKLGEWLSRAAAMARGFWDATKTIAGVVWDIWDAVTELVPGLGDATSSLETWKIVGKVLAGLLGGALLAALISATSAAWGFAAALLANPITWIILGIIALIAAGYLLWKHWDKVTAFFANVWDEVKERWGWFVDDIAALAGKFKAEFIDKPVAHIKAGWNSLMVFLGDIWQRVTGWVSGFEGLTLAEAGKRLLQGYLDAMTAVWDFLFGWMDDVFRSINDWVADLTGFDLLASGRELLGGFWDGLKGIWTDITTWFDESLTGINDWIADIIGIDLLKTGRDLIDGFWIGIKGVWSDMDKWISDAIQTLIGWLPTWITDRLGLTAKAETTSTTVNRTETAPIPQGSAVGAAQQVNGKIVVEVKDPSGRTSVQSVKQDGNAPVDLAAQAALGSTWAMGRF